MNKRNTNDYAAILLDRNERKDNLSQWGGKYFLSISKKGIK